MAPYQRAIVVLAAFLFTGAHALPSGARLFERQDNSSSLVPTGTMTSSAPIDATATSTVSSPSPSQFILFEQQPCQTLSPPVTDGQTCDVLLGNKTLFFELNPDVAPSCNNPGLVPKQPYCLAPFTGSLPVTPNGNITNTCAGTAVAHSNDTCADMAVRNNITVLALQLMNPEIMIGSECKGLVADDAYCVNPMANSPVVNTAFLGMTTSSSTNATTTGA
ncbi:hypothetical protein DFH07DRAFT_945219 [Mycena maculata]|uniref:LysM domain-containing protein n=1 Tax=Mycena maculata TaxID=230809 RepID=A0AAD7MTA3_9AGAR|nr:hypothetical protein DFH07DRAFT_945219 [Mycena maculata]